VHPQAQPIDCVVELGPSVCLLLAMCWCVIVLTVMADRPLPQDPVLSAGAQLLSQPSTRSSAVTYPAGTTTAPWRRSVSVANRGYHRSQGRFLVRQATTITPVGMDRSFDLRADLMDMAIAIRCHRGPASDLPPGSD
jgi:hypothetical protein